MHAHAQIYTHFNVLAAGGIETRLYESQLLFIPSDSVHTHTSIELPGTRTWLTISCLLAAFVLKFKSNLITLIRLYSSAEMLSEFSETRTEESYTPRPFLGSPKQNAYI